MRRVNSCCVREQNELNWRNGKTFFDNLKGDIEIPYRRKHNTTWDWFSLRTQQEINSAHNGRQLRDYQVYRGADPPS